MIRALIAEDQAMMRGALALLLDMEHDISVVAQVGRGDEVVAGVREHRPDIALLDIEMPGISGIDAAAALHTEAPECAVMIVTTFARAGYLRRALDAGARGFVVKDDPVEDLAQAVRKVVAGSTVIDPGLAEEARLAPANPLTDGERRVLAAAADGSPVNDLAARLHLSDRTVRNYLSAAIGKTGSRTRAEAAIHARDQGWL
ncbi:response regulator transcription factor [Solicola gregarius]|uniref:Response regulator transcription factor n=1 Tax=Solicola gregarius TaxID=2908642 RepID=A0AA46TJL1_9ACTN|nr:response regulator transcription factor [Solicola gregarius]UYM06475.1 response regulator transcription factor [Solicola gregarius]